MKGLNILENEKGVSIAIFTIILTVIMLCASVTVDIGLTISEKTNIAKAVDSSVLAGAQELVESKDSAVSVTKSYLQKNGVNPKDANISVSDDGKSISVISKKDVNYYFARIIGYNKGEVSAKAAAKVMPVSGVSSGTRPFAVEDQILNFGQRYVLKEGAGNGSSGNYGLLALGGTGASNLRDNIIFGYDGELKVGDYIDTETGNKNGPTQSAVQTLISSCIHSPKCTYSNFDQDCPRIITIIIIDSLDVNGRKKVRIEGFATFFLENIEENGGHTQITGRFIKTIQNGEVTDTQKDYGLRGIKLVS